MRKLLFLSFFIFLISQFQLIGQNEPGSFYLNIINIGFGTNTTNLKTFSRNVHYAKGSSFGFEPQMGLFVAPNLVAGLEVPVHSSTDKDYKTKLSLTAIGPFLRYYMGFGKVRPYLHAGFGYGKATGSRANTGKLSYLDFSSGIAIFVHPNISFEIAFNYLYAHIKVLDTVAVVHQNNQNQKEAYQLNSNDTAFHVGFAMQF